MWEFSSWSLRGCSEPASQACGLGWIVGPGLVVFNNSFNLGSISSVTCVVVSAKLVRTDWVQSARRRGTNTWIIFGVCIQCVFLVQTFVLDFWGCLLEEVWIFLRISANQDHFDLCSVPAPAYYCRAPASVPLVYTWSAWLHIVYKYIASLE